MNTAEHIRSRNRTHSKRHPKHRSVQPPDKRQEKQANRNWDSELRRAKREMTEARWIAGLPKNQRPPVHVAKDRAMQYRTQLPKPTQAAQFHRQANPQHTDRALKTLRSQTTGTADVMSERAEITAPASTLDRKKRSQGLCYGAAKVS